MPEAAARRLLRRDADGTLTDATSGDVIPLDLLADEVRAGRRFRAHSTATGHNCTLEVLTEVLECVVRVDASTDLLSLLGRREQRE